MSKSQKDVPSVSLKSLFEAYDKADEGFNKFRSALEQATTARSNAVKAIVEAADSKGAFNWRGRLLTATVRQSKSDPDKPPTYFFRSPGDSDTIDVS